MRSMHRQSAGVLFALLLAAVASRADAQWFKYPTPGKVPRLASGAVDMKAPTPRTSEGKPDFSGVWLAANHLPCPPLLSDGKGDCLEKTPLSAWAYNIDAGSKEPLPLQPWAAAARKERFAANSADDPHAKCLPNNPPRSYTLPHFQKIIQTPYFIAMLTEFNASFRQVFTDGRPLPVDPNPSWSGYSTGRWEGETLVVRTNGLRDGMWLDMSGTPITDAATLTERISRPNYGTLDIAFTVDDPKAYTKPWTVNLRQDIIVDADLIEEICLEGLRPMHLPQ